MAQIPPAEKGMTCPLRGQDMSKVCHKCPLWVKVTGKNPQSEEHVDRWNCSLAWLPMLLIENSQMQRQTGAAVESARNEHVTSMKEFGSRVENAVARAASQIGADRDRPVLLVQGVVPNQS